MLSFEEKIVNHLKEKGSNLETNVSKSCRRIY